MKFLILFLLLLTGCSVTPRAPSNSIPFIKQQIVQEDGTIITTQASPSEQALADWVKYGAILAFLGILLFLPIFGAHYRSGAITFLGGAAMALTGTFIGNTVVTIPVWFLPSLVIILVAGMLYGFSIKHKNKVSVHTHTTN